MKYTNKQLQEIKEELLKEIAAKRTSITKDVVGDYNKGEVSGFNQALYELELLINKLLKN